jgi:membrane dipeptidase
MGSEGGKLLEGNLAALRNFHRLGMRHLQFHWSIRNQLGTAQGTPNEPGLTEFGREVVAEMNSLGMIVDLSHSSPHSIEDALETTTKPVINSHSGARTIYNTQQNLWDDQIRDMADNGGVVAIHFATRIVLGEYPTSTIDDLIAQIEHVADVGGIDTVGLGPDFFEDGGPRSRNVMKNQGQSPMPWTADLEDTGKLRNLTRALVGRGYRDRDIVKILGGNLMRVFEAALG